MLRVLGTFSETGHCGSSLGHLRWLISLWLEFGALLGRTGSPQRGIAGSVGTTPWWSGFEVKSCCASGLGQFEWFEGLEGFEGFEGFEVFERFEGFEGY